MQPRLIKIRSKDNAFQHIEVLKRNREKRTRYGEFVLEGVRGINAALQHGWEVVSFIYPAGRKLSGWAAEILSQSRAREHLEMKAELMAELSDKEETSELLAVVRCSADELQRLKGSRDMLIVLFDRPGNPGNLGSSIRSCDALGASGAIITGHAADLYDPVTVRASVGSLFALPVVRQPSALPVTQWIAGLRAQGIPLQVVGSDENGAAPLESCDFNKPTLLVMGNETSGMAEAYRELCDVVVRIPMSGTASSLNVSCAASICLYESARQRLKAAGSS